MIRKIKLTDYIAEYLADLDVSSVFVLQGGAALHLIDSVAKNPKLTSVPMQHEQASAMAADAMARVSGNIGVTISTSGPGATNLITGIACSYFDSIATLHITGNVSSFRQSDKLNVRQYGFQETDIVSMVTPVTKYAVKIESSQDIVTELPKAVAIARSGRPGPVLIDIPDDLQREEIFCSNDNFSWELKDGEVGDEIDSDIIGFIEALKASERPVFIFGSGLLNCSFVGEAVKLSKKLDIPYLITWPLKGCDDSGHSLNLGSFGTHSYRGNNFVVQNSDFIISIGSRLDTRATAKISTFAREAKICMVDIDFGEINKFALLHNPIDFPMHMSCEIFLKAINKFDLPRKNYSSWLRYINNVREELNKKPSYDLGKVDPYLAISSISKHFSDDEIIFVDTGTCLPLTLVYAEEKKGQRYISSFNNTPMGYALPAAIGGAFSVKRPLTCIVGDGGLQMNVQELATVAKFNLPIKIVVFNNSGHAMIKQTQDDWLESHYVASDSDSGLPSINFHKVAQAYGIKSIRIEDNSKLEVLFQLFQEKGPVLIELVISENFRYEPIIKYGNPLENMSPELEKEILYKHMIVDADY